MGLIAVATTPAFSEDIVADSPFLLISMPSAKVGAIFLTVTNNGAHDDTLVGASTIIAERTELHTHTISDDGIARMREVEEGFPVPASESIKLERGGDHVMLMGLKQKLADGEIVDLTLRFERTGDVELKVPVRVGH